MHSIEFPYTYYKGLYIPVVPLQLSHRSAWFEHWAYVDSGAIYSGFAMVVTLMIPARRWYKLEAFITDRHLDYMAKIMLATGLIVF